MKRYVLQAIALLLTCFAAGGIYIYHSFQNSTTNLNRLNELHKVEFLRKSLEQDIEAVQADLLLQDTPHTDIETTVSRVEKLEQTAESCQDCHHEPDIRARLEEMSRNVSRYMTLYSRALTTPANDKRNQEKRELAYDSGIRLIQEVRSLSVASADKIAARTNQIHSELWATNQFLLACLVIGPASILIITILIFKNFSRSVNVLVTAAEDLRKGDLNRHIREPLKDEFRTLADSFNAMVDSLNIERQNFLTAHSLYQALFEAAGDGICILYTGDRLGEIVSVNPALCEMYGYTAEEFQHMNCMELSTEEYTEQFCQKMQVILDGQWVSCSLPRLRKDGSEFLADISAGPLQINQEEYILTFTRDVTEKQKTAKEMQRANQMAIVGQMAAGLAHEIKNPLAGIKVSLEVISDELDIPSEDKEVFARVLSEIERMERLLKGLLNYARPPTPHFDLVDINRLLEYSIKNIAITASREQTKQVVFEKELNELAQIEADSSQLQQVFLNIYINALDAIREGGKVTTITRMEDDGQVRIEIRDTGDSLSESAMEKMFNPFYTTKKKGSGLGLAICKRLIEQHHGSISVHREAGKETTFVILLPVSQKDEGTFQ